jgi:outer membrane immunogenic protein
MLVAGIMAGVLSSGVAMGAPRQPLIARPVTPPYDWSGWRLGVYVGGGWNNGSQWTNPDDGDLGALSTSGVVSLFTLSYAWQSGNVVVAVEGGGGPTDVRGNFESHNWNFSGQLKGLETVRGKLGVATGASGNVLWYGTVGAAWAQYKFGSIWPETNSVFSASSSLNGWTAGAGIEYGIAPNWSLKAEYIHYDFGSGNVNLIPNNDVPVYPVHSTNWRVDAFVGGFAYKLGYPQAGR